MSKGSRSEAKKNLMYYWDKLSYIKTSNLLIHRPGDAAATQEQYFKAVQLLVLLADSTTELVYEIAQDLDKIEDRLNRLDRGPYGPPAVLGD